MTPIDIKAIRISAHLSQREFAVCAGLSYKTVLEFEKGRKVCKKSIEKIEKVCENIDIHKKEETRWRKFHRNCFDKQPIIHPLIVKIPEPAAPTLKPHKTLKSPHISYNDLQQEVRPYNLPDRHSRLQQILLSRWGGYRDIPTTLEKTPQIARKVPSSFIDSGFLWASVLGRAILTFLGIVHLISWAVKL